MCALYNPPKTCHYDVRIFFGLVYYWDKIKFTVIDFYVKKSCIPNILVYTGYGLVVY